MRKTKYKNTKTGEVLKTVNRLKGGNWVEVVEQTKQPEPQTDEVVEEEEVDLEEMTKNELIEFAKEQDVTVNAKDTKAAIIETIAKAFE